MHNEEKEYKDQVQGHCHFEGQEKKVRQAMGLGRGDGRGEGKPGGDAFAFLTKIILKLILCKLHYCLKHYTG